MRQLARALTNRFRASNMARGAGFRLSDSAVLDALLTVLPIVLLGGARVAGIHLGLGFYGQLWFGPLMLGAILWGFRGALGVGAAAALAVAPPVAGAILASGTEVSLAQWIGQLALYGMFVALIGLATGRRSLKSQMGVQAEAGRMEGMGTPAESDRVLASLANTVEVRDHHTQGHCRRVARNAIVMGRALGLNNGDLKTLYWAAILHDLGKIAVPEYILLKSGRLTEEEYAEIQRHPAYGADLLASVSSSYRPIADVVRAHHERWDGLGYPLGLAGEQIPEMARVIAVVDVFEALTSERPYRSPMPEQQALEYVKNGAGTQFDPGLVQLFAQLHVGSKIESAVASASTGPQSSFSRAGSAIAHNL